MLIKLILLYCFFVIKAHYDWSFTKCFVIPGYSASALLAIIFAIPFGIRLLFHRDRGRWRNFSEAFYSAYFELFLGNACICEYRVFSVNLNFTNLIIIVFSCGCLDAISTNNWTLCICVSSITYATSTWSTKVTNSQIEIISIFYIIKKIAF